MNAIATLQKKIDQAGGIRKAALLLEISQSYLSDIMLRKRGISVEFASRTQQKMGINALDLLKWQAVEDWRTYQERKGTR